MYIAIHVHVLGVHVRVMCVRHNICAYVRCLCVCACLWAHVVYVMCVSMGSAFVHVRVRQRKITFISHTT